MKPKSQPAATAQAGARTRTSSAAAPRSFARSSARFALVLPVVVRIAIS